MPLRELSYMADNQNITYQLQDLVAQISLRISHGFILNYKVLAYLCYISSSLQFSHALFVPSTILKLRGFTQAVSKWSNCKPCCLCGMHAWGYSIFRLVCFPWPISRKCEEKENVCAGSRLRMLCGLRCFITLTRCGSYNYNQYMPYCSSWSRGFLQ